MRVLEFKVKLWTGKSASSSSLNSGEGGSSAMVEPSEIKESCVKLLEGKRACLVCVMGEDSGRPCCCFQETWRAETVRRFRLLTVAAPEGANFCMSDGRIFLLL